MNRDHNLRRPARAASGADSKAIVSMVAAGQPNPFAAGSPEHIAYAWTRELLRHTESESTGNLARHARRVFPGARRRSAARRAAGTEGAEAAATVPPVPEENPRRPSLHNPPPPLPGTKPKVPYDKLWSPDQLLHISNEFAEEIDAAENSHGNWGLESDSSTGIGRYQLLLSGLKDIGLVDRSEGQWYGPPYPTRDEFLKSPQLQNFAFEAYLKKKLGYLENLGLTRFVGQEIEGIADTFDVTEGGLLAASHREGEGWVKKYLAHLEANDWVSDSDTFPTYDVPPTRKAKDIFLSIETRLRTFSTVPLYASADTPALIDTERSE